MQYQRLPQASSTLFEDDDERASLLLGKPIEERYLDRKSKNSICLGFFIFIFLGLTPQLLQNAIFSQTAVFREVLPEGKAIGAYVITMFMLANIVHFIYLTFEKKIPDNFFIFLMFIGNGTMTFILAFLWKDQTTLKGLGEISYIVLLSAFISGLFGNASTIILFSFARNYKGFLTPAISFGYGFSGFLVSVLTLSQNPSDLRFSITDYFCVIGGLCFLGLFLFIIFFLSPLNKKLYSVTSNYFSVVFSCISLKESSNGQFRVIHSNRFLFLRSWGSLILMLINSIILFWIAGLICFFPGENLTIAWLNSGFLFLPTIGTALAGLIKTNYIFLTGCIQVIFFIFIILPEITRFTLFRIPSAVEYSFFAIFLLLSGFNTTKIHINVRKEFKSNLPDAEKVSKWISIINQLGAFIGILINDLLIYYRVYGDSK